MSTNVATSQSSLISVLCNKKEKIIEGFRKLPRAKVIMYGAICIAAICGIYFCISSYVNSASYGVCRDNYKAVVCNCVKSSLTTSEKIAYLRTSHSSKLRVFMLEHNNSATKIIQCISAHNELANLLQ